MAEQRKTVAEIIEEMRAELREAPDEDAELFAPYVSRPRKNKAPAKKAGRKKAKKKASKKKAKKKARPAKKKPKPTKKPGKRKKKR